jgi:hypothetical protein
MNKEIFSNLTTRFLSAFLVVVIMFAVIFTYQVPRSQASYVIQPTSGSSLTVTNDNGAAGADKKATVAGSATGAVFEIVEDGSICSPPKGGLSTLRYTGSLSVSLIGVSNPIPVTNQTTNFTSGTPHYINVCDSTFPGLALIRSSGSFSIELDVSALSNGTHNFQVTVKTTNNGPGPSTGVPAPNSEFIVTGSVNVQHPSGTPATCTVTVRGSLNNTSAITGAEFEVFGPVLARAFENGSATFQMPINSNYQLVIISANRQISSYDSVPFYPGDPKVPSNVVPTGRTEGSCNGANGQSITLYVNYITIPVLQLQ